jgi:hypothetical protein
VNLLSVNISPTILVEINGQQVQTAINKTPFQGRFWLCKLTLWGYGKAAASLGGLVLTFEHFTYWQYRLKKPHLELNLKELCR